MRRAERELQEAIYADSVEESVIANYIRELSEAQAEFTRLRVGTELRVREILTPEQLSHFRLLRQQVRAGRQQQRDQFPPLRPRHGRRRGVFERQQRTGPSQHNSPD